ncbi:hypothetical protein [Rurimicrobium arvi]|uniref:SoxR reducing system RseC family protein n=1 Tax=Rurimicrobium arvi TaxID=2049916 RepID=A0ABP8N056_9BACT
MPDIMDKVTEAMGWIRIALSPAVAGGLTGGFIYLSYPGPDGVLAGLSCVLMGVITGAVWATRIARRKGTIRFLSQSRFTPELDDAAACTGKDSAN